MKLVRELMQRLPQGGLEVADTLAR